MNERTKCEGCTFSEMIVVTIIDWTCTAARQFASLIFESYIYISDKKTNRLTKRMKELPSEAWPLSVIEFIRLKKQKPKGNIITALPLLFGNDILFIKGFSTNYHLVLTIPWRYDHPHFIGKKVRIRYTVKLVQLVIGQVCNKCQSQTLHTGPLIFLTDHFFTATLLVYILYYTQNHPKSSFLWKW